MLGDRQSTLQARYRAALGGNALTDSSSAASALRALHQRRLLDVSRPGYGRTLERLHALTELAAIDLSLGRLAEGHLDAHAILLECGAQPKDGCYGVWAAEGSMAVTATPAADGYMLSGRKRYASGASSLDRALVTARAPDGPRLFDVPLSAAGVKPVAGSWRAVGMASSDSLDVDFHGVFVPASAAIGGPRSYLDRVSFWHGGVGVAACWYGGALGCARVLFRALTDHAPDDHAAAHAGEVRLQCHVMSELLASAAREIDDDPQDALGRARQRALLVRSGVERGCELVLNHTHRALGSGAMVFDAEHARRAADLPVYVRQHHAERDLAELGRAALHEEGWL